MCIYVAADKKQQNISQYRGLPTPFLTKNDKQPFISTAAVSSSFYSDWSLNAAQTKHLSNSAGTSHWQHI